MPGYWWECESCKQNLDFKAATGFGGIASFIWDKLLVTDWDQKLLAQPCKNCGHGLLRIAYEFPRKDKTTLRVVHIIGLKSNEYVPMMWETYATDDPDKRWFDFKYQNGRNPIGLKAPAVLTRQNLHELFKCYCQKTGVREFP